MFRKRAIGYKDTGHTLKGMHEARGVDSKRYYSWKRRLEEAGSLERKPPKERGRKTNKKESPRLIEGHPDWHLRAFAEKLDVWPRAAHKTLGKRGVAYKRNVCAFGKA
ncbi:MAG: transposase [Treponema sp.]|nr:transposase [Treponema sp.]